MKRTLNLGLLIAAVGVCCLSPTVANRVFGADEALTLTVTPPLFQLNLQPGETWTSGIQVVNSNPYDITVYAEPVPFRPSGEDGRPQFITAPTGDAGAQPDISTLAGWIVVPQTPIAIAREKTAVIPLAVTVPKDAMPGGQYAAVLIGNRAPEGSARDGDTLSVTSSIASLILLRVAGDVQEKGRIRDFVTERSLYENAEATLSLRFENEGNVHLQPQGDITIYNMFGKKRGYIAVNQNADYGNVLPGSIRKFTYTWRSDAGSWDIGRYRAEATLGFGSDAKQFVSATTYFYILPVWPLAQVLAGILGIVFFFGWAVRAYIRRALALESLRAAYPGAGAPEGAMHASTEHERPQLRLTTLVRPLTSGMVDLRAEQPNATDMRLGEVGKDNAAHRTDVHRHMTFLGFLKAYQFFFLFVLLVSFVWLAASAFFADVLIYERAYTVTEVHDHAGQ